MVVSKTQIGADENKCFALGLVFLLQVWGRGVETDRSGAGREEK